MKIFILMLKFLNLRYTLTHSASSSSVGQQESGCTVLVILYNTVITVSLSLSLSLSL